MQIGLSLNKKPHQKGFTLIEIMIVVAIVTILASIALPAYNNYINRGKLKTAQADLVALGLNIENQYQRILAYPGATIATTALIKAAYTGWVPASNTADFAFSTADASATTYSVVATGQSGGVKDCVLTLKHDGTKTLTSCSYGNGSWL